jgi:Domain of unknown function DUF29
MKGNIMKTQKKTVKTIPKQLSVCVPISSENELEHEKDFFKWTRNQINLLKKKEFTKLDISHLIEEIESLGNSEKNAIESHLIVLFLYLLKIDHQPAMRSNSWNNSVENSKFRIMRLVQKNPSLKRKVSEFISDAYYSAKLEASSETGLEVKTFPEECPWTFEELFPDLNKKFRKSL